MYKEKNKLFIRTLAFNIDSEMYKNTIDNLNARIKTLKDKATVAEYYKK